MAISSYRSLLQSSTAKFFDIAVVDNPGLPLKY